ncbi:hypothetical protein EDB89DRAFT_2176697, partial [Lactarius sanguifluus]
LIFYQVSQSDLHVCNALGTRKTTCRLLRACELLEPEYMLKDQAIKHLSMNAMLLEVLQSVNAIEILTRILDERSSGSLSTVRDHIFQTCYNLCRLNECRQAQAGIIPLLICVIESSSPCRQFVFTILCDLASAGKGCWMLQCPSNFSRISTSLSSLFWHGFKRRQLGQRTSWRDPSELLDALLKCLISAKAGSFENLLDPSLKICHHSTPIVKAQVFRCVSEKLSNSKAVVIREAEPAVHPPRRLRRAEPRAARRVLRHTRGGFRALRKDGDVLVRERSSLASHMHPSPPSEVPIRPRARPRRRDAPRGAPPATRLISARRRPHLARARWTIRASRALVLAWPLARRADSRRAYMLAISRGSLASARDGAEQRRLAVGAVCTVL